MSKPNTLQKALDALKVISYDPQISGWLEDNDPNALKQVREALCMANEEPLSRNQREATRVDDGASL